MSARPNATQRLKDLAAQMTPPDGDTSWRIGKTVPEALEAESVQQERVLIGALLQDRDAILSIGGWLRDGAFLDTDCRNAYRAIVQCFEDRVAPDFSTIQHGYAKLGLAKQYDLSFLTELLLEVPFGSHAPFYADNVANLARRRAYVELAQQFSVGAASGDYDFDTAYQKMLGRIEGLRPDKRMPVPYAESIPKFRDTLERLWQNDGTVVRDVVSTGFVKLDRILDDGFACGELIVIAARPSMGKSALMLQLAINGAREELRLRPNAPRWTVIYSAEMSMESLLWRTLAEATGIDIRRLKSGVLADQYKDDVRRMLDLLATLPIAIDDMSGILTGQMLDRARRMSIERPVRMVYFDYIEKAGDWLDGDALKVNEERRVSFISSRMKDMARMLPDCTVVALSQLSRAVEARKAERFVPTLADLRQSGMIEANADRVLLLYREDYYVEKGLLDASPDKQGTCDVILAKNREGETGTFPLLFLPYITAFREMDDTD
jgi:replicative DNA helicase